MCMQRNTHADSERQISYLNFPLLFVSQFPAFIIAITRDSNVRFLLARYVSIVNLCECRNVRRILVREVSAPLPPEAKKISKISLRNVAF